MDVKSTVQKHFIGNFFSKQFLKKVILFCELSLLKVVDSIFNQYNRFQLQLEIFYTID